MQTLCEAELTLRYQEALKNLTALLVNGFNRLWPLNPPITAL